MDLTQRLVVVTGKGGVGKTTVATSLALARASAGTPTLLVETGGRSDVLRLLGRRPSAHHGQTRLAARLSHRSLDAPLALRRYLQGHLPRGATPLLLAGGAFEMLAAATPGLAELLSIGQIWELTEPDESSDTRVNELVIFDAPSTGHALALLHAPRTYAQAARTGPVHAQALRIQTFLGDWEQTAIVAVTTAERLAVNETIDLRDDLRDTLGIDLSCVVVNSLLPGRFSPAEVGVLRRGPSSRWRRASLFTAERSRHQQSELRRLRDALGDVPTFTLPFLFGPVRGAAGLRPLTEALEQTGP